MSADGKSLRFLTARERRVLKLVAKAQTNKEIAATLGISPSTVKRHIENILKKLRLKNRVQAAVYAVRMSDCPAELGNGQERDIAA